MKDDDLHVAPLILSSFTAADLRESHHKGALVCFAVGCRAGCCSQTAFHTPERNCSNDLKTLYVLKGCPLGGHHYSPDIGDFLWL